MNGQSILNPVASASAICLSLGTVIFAEDAVNANWPHAAGQNHNWTLSTRQSVPLKWSAEKNENIRWRLTLPECGQSGMTVWEDRLFLTTMKPLAADAVEKQGTDIVLYCVSASDGKILCQQELAGDPQAKSIYTYGFSCSQGRLYHRTLKKLLCIEAKP